MLDIIILSLEFFYGFRYIKCVCVCLSLKILINIDFDNDIWRLMEKNQIMKLNV